VYLSARQDDVRTVHFSTATTTSTSTLATLALRGYHLHVVLIGFYYSHNIRAITTLQLRGMSACRILPSTYSPVLPSPVYLVGYIFCIIDCHISQDILDIIDIMYCRLPYVSRTVLPLKTLVLYIYRPRGRMQYNQQLYAIYSSYRSKPLNNILLALFNLCRHFLYLYLIINQKVEQEMKQTT
jgi:hypothetical protein